MTDEEKKEKEKLELELSSKKDELRAVVDTANKYSLENEFAKKDLEKLNAGIRDKKEQLSDISKEVSKKEKIISEKETEITTHNREISQLSSKKHDLEEEIESLTHDFEDKKSKMTEEHRAAVSSHTQKVKELKEVIENANETIKAAEAKKDKLSVEHGELVVVNSNLEHRAKSFESQIIKLEEKVSELSKEQKESVRSIQFNTEQNSKLQKDLEDKRKELSQVTEKYHEIKKEMEAFVDTQTQKIAEGNERLKILEEAELRVQSKVDYLNKLIEKQKVDGFLKDSIKV